MRPTVWSLTPETDACTAKRRTAPIAMSRSEVPMPMLTLLVVLVPERRYQQERRRSRMVGLIARVASGSRRSLAWKPSESALVAGSSPAPPTRDRLPQLGQQHLDVVRVGRGAGLVEDMDVPSRVAICRQVEVRISVERCGPPGVRVDERQV